MSYLIALLALLLSAPAFAQEAQASCMALSGQAYKVCVERRAATHAAQIAAAQRAAAEVQQEVQECLDSCDDTPTPRRSTGPSRTYLVLDAYGKRLEALENAPETPGPTGPTGATGATGPTGATGAKGDKGDPAPIEGALLIGVAGLHPEGWNILGGELVLRAGWLPSKRWALGVQGSAFVAGANDLGFGVGGYTSFAATPGFVPGLVFVWREMGVDLTTAGGLEVFQALEAKGRLEIRPVKDHPWVLAGEAGVHFGVNNPALVWGVQTGVRFK